MSDVAPSRVVPHPRIRQRRVEVKRDEGRRRLRILVGTLVCTVVAGGVYGITRSPLLDVDTVRVRGAAATTAADVLRVSGLDRHPPLTDLDTDGIAEAIEGLPWVERAEVTRHFPNRVEVTLLERTPVAAVPVNGDVWAAVDLSGRVLAHAPGGPPAELTRIETATPAGPPGTPIAQPTRDVLAVIDALPEVIAGRVPSVAVDEGGAIELRLDGKIPVLFGRPAQVEPKFVALATLVTKADLRRVRVIDVRVPTAPVLTRG